MHRHRSNLAAAITAAVLGLFAVVATVPAEAANDGLDGDRARIEAVRSQRAAAAAKIDTLKANESQTKRALDALDDDVRGQEALYANARRTASAAEADAETARTAAQAQEAALAVLSQRARQAALDAYVDPPDDLGASLDVVEATDAIVRKTLAGVASRRATDVLDAYDAAKDDLTYRRTLAERAAAKAAARRAAADDRLQTLQVSLQRQRQTVAEIEDQLDNALSEAAGLAGLDATLSNQLASKQAALAARLASARALADRAGGGSPELDFGAGRDVGSIVVMNVGGIDVNASIAGQVRALLGAARSSGINLAGAGYRSSRGQVTVRRANCGSSRYAIYSMPPSRCRPPAARPGKSMHELGLAIDFTCDGGLITSRSNRCFRWLQGHAAAYGLQNYWREPWHWSTNGR